MDESKTERYFGVIGQDKEGRTVTFEVPAMDLKEARRKADEIGRGVIISQVIEAVGDSMARRKPSNTV